MRACPSVDNQGLTGEGLALESQWSLTSEVIDIDTLPAPTFVWVIAATYYSPIPSGKVVSAGTNGEVVQWQAFLFDPTVCFDPTAPLSSTRRASATGKPSGSDSHSETSASMTATRGIAPNASLVGLINARRNRQEDKLQKNLRSRDPSEPTLRRIGHEAPRGDGRVGGVDVFEMDYQVSRRSVRVHPPDQLGWLWS